MVKANPLIGAFDQLTPALQQANDGVFGACCERSNQRYRQRVMRRSENMRQGAPLCIQPFPPALMESGQSMRKGIL
jgi:hypothetical protein